MRIYNSLTRTKEEFVPQDPNLVTMYACGPTVYDTPHLGNARPAVVFDVLFRVLNNLYPGVKYARNITDVDDKIINKAKTTGKPISTITTSATKVYHDAMAALNVLAPTVEPKATESIDDMIALSTTLIDKGYAYVVGGDLYFDLTKLPDDFQSLARHNVDDLVAQNDTLEKSKRHPNDFALWKSANEGWAWDHPEVGKGRPGWHLECSAMIKNHLGKTIDIHAGGNDLRFPHHEAEMAQSFAAHDAPLANYWMHNGMITVDGKKMAKSTGNFITVDEALTRFPGEAIRFYMLKTHYRKPFDWTWEGLEEAKGELDSLYRKMESVEQKEAVMGIVGAEHTLVLNPLEDDLNTPAAIVRLHQIDPSQLRASGALMGILESDNWFTNTDVDVEWIEQLIQSRDNAREHKDYVTSDTIRDTLLAQGIVLEDKDGTTTWRRK